MSKISLNVNAKTAFCYFNMAEGYFFNDLSLCGCESSLAEPATAFFFVGNLPLNQRKPSLLLGTSR